MKGRHWGVTSAMKSTAREVGYFAAMEACHDGGSTYVKPYEWNKNLPLRIRIGLFPPDGIRRDVDNIVSALKSYQDGVFDYLDWDDSAIRGKTIIMHPPRRPDGMVYYILYQLGG
jgi:hypothetical protein